MVKMETKSRKGIVLIILLSVLTFVFVFIAVYRTKESEIAQSQALSKVSQQDLPVMRAVDLSQYDGTDLTKPIYIGLNGYVYDVSAGKDYYKVDGTYHYLAGKDSSQELNLIGGDIIQKKYPIVGKLVN